MNDLPNFIPQASSTTAESDAGRLQRRDEVPPVPSAGGVSTVSSKIMIVDDDALTIEMLQAFLEEVGYNNFISTSRPAEALDLLYNERPDVLLLNLFMPGVSGFDILRRMKGDTILNHIPVIMLTAAADSATKLEALNLGATDFLAKPVDSSELVLRLRNTLTAEAHQDQLT